MRFAGSALAAVALAAAPFTGAAAQDGKPTTAKLTAQIAEGGTWDFTTRDRLPDGKPVCSETWTFRPDGTATVISGQQQVEKTWSAEVDGDGLQWLYTTSLSGTAGPDCTGELEDPASFPRPESGFVLLFFSGGNALTCQPPEWIDGPDGKPVQLWTDGACWGGIIPKPKG